MSALLHPAPAAPHCSEPAPHLPQRTLVVGALDIPAKEQLVLRSLLRVMDGKNDCALRYSDTLSDCNVILTPVDADPRVSRSCVAVQLLAEDGSGAPAPCAGLSIRSPLRLSNTGPVLQAAADLLADRALPVPAPTSLGPLLAALLQQITANERHTTVFPLGNERAIIVNFSSDSYYSALPLAELLQGSFTLGAPRRANDADLAGLAAKGSRKLRELLWQATNKLIDSGESAAPLAGHFRLLRWPDAAALSRPGIPMLAALLTKRACTVEQARQFSGASIGAISWFLRTNLALGIAQVEETAAHGVPAHDKVQSQQSQHLTAQSMLRRIRDRLKLW